MSRHITDRIYGNIEITEPVLLELIESPTLKRLEGIDSAGYFEPHFPGTSRTRFEHSIGVMHLLKMYGAPIEEQVAGLIHDVSHSVFSHAIDYVLSEGSGAKQHHQDNLHIQYVKSSDIPAIVAKYDLAVDYILNDENFPLKERELPDLCADRIDYSFREGVLFGEISTSEALEFLNALRIHDRQWVFTDQVVARRYADVFCAMNSKYYSNVQSAVMFYSVGSFLKHGLKQHYITLDDLYTTDNDVLKKINSHLPIDTQLQKLWTRMNNKIPYANDPHDYEAEVHVKSRIVDPLYQADGTLQRLSDNDPIWKTVVHNELKPKTYYLKFSDT